MLSPIFLCLYWSLGLPVMYTRVPKAQYGYRDRKLPEQSNKTRVGGLSVNEMAPGLPDFRDNGCRYGSYHS